MKLIIDVPDMTEAQLAALQEATGHREYLHNARLKWLTPNVNPGRGSLVTEHPVTSAEAVKDAGRRTDGFGGSNPLWEPA